MHLLRTLPLLCALTSVSYAFPTFGSVPVTDKFVKSSVFEKLIEPPVGWVKDDAAHFDKDTATVKLRIHLVQQGMSRFHEMAMKVCIPIFYSIAGFVIARGNGEMCSFLVSLPYWGHPRSNQPISIVTYPLIYTQALKPRVY